MAKKKHGREKISNAKLKKILFKDPWNVVLYPHLAEKSMRLVDLENKMVFVVNPKADKQEIKKAVQELFSVSVISVDTEITRFGEKKAFVKLASSNSATDLASKLGVM